MLQTWVVDTVAGAYLALLFAIAYYGDRRADSGRSLISNSSIYALSLAVYATSWTFYGSVGRAATTGVGFLPIYLGPTLMAALGWYGLRKGYRGRFGMYMPPLLEALGLAELTHDARNNRMRAKG